MGLRRVILAAAAVFGVLPLSLFRDMSNLAKTSFLSLVAVAWIVCVVMVRSVAGAPGAVMPAASDRVMHAVNKDVFPAIGVIAFAFVCHHNSFIVFNSLREPTVGNWAKTANWSVFISVVASCILALFGYFQFRELTDDNLLNNYAITDELVNVTRLLYAFTMILTYPLEMFVSRHCISCIWWRLKHAPLQAVAAGTPGNVASEALREEVESASGLLTVGETSCNDAPPPLSTVAHWSITLLLFSASLLIALLTSRLGIVLELTGGISATVLGFIMPAGAFNRQTCAFISLDFRALTTSAVFQVHWYSSVVVASQCASRRVVEARLASDRSWAVWRDCLLL
jgi:solute carrier family 38 (sodium-coupled neutral amino acid transporter), member 11